MYFSKNTSTAFRHRATSPIMSSQNEDTKLMPQASGVQMDSATKTAFSCPQMSQSAAGVAPATCKMDELG